MRTARSEIVDLMASGTPASRVEFSSPQVNLYSPELENSLRFYRDTLGFIETFRTPKEGAPDHVELKLGTFTLGIASFTALKREHGIETSPGPPRFELGLGTADVDGAYAWAISHGAHSEKPPHDFLGYIHSARVADPDGNHVVFYSRLPIRASTSPEVRPKFRTHLFNVYTNDIDRSLRFYRDLLGFAETFRVPDEGTPDHVEMELGSLNLGISTLEALRRDHGLTGGGGPPRAEVVLWVEDVVTAYAWLRAQGAPSLSPPHDFARVLRAAWLNDPDGNPVQVVQRRGAP
jgi:catechol 2,3-dioxygenase-like lactoylglutathione lyase family enzyme